MENCLENMPPLEQAYAEKLRALFALVDAAKPERGIQTILTRARQDAEAHNLPLETTLENHYQAAEAQTHRRLALTRQCSVTANTAD